MSKVLTFAIAIVFTLTLWLKAERKEGASDIHLATSFDFAAYPSCGTNARNCIKAIRFYDADSGQLLSEVETTADMTGRQSILGIAKVSSIPRKVYAATVYLDSEGRLNQGLPGQTTAEYCRRDKDAASAAGETNRKLNGHPEC